MNKYISLLIAWVSVSAFLLNLIAGLLPGGDPSVIINPPDIIAFLIRTIILFVFVPLIFTLIYPVGWMLVDAKLKAFDSRTQLNWLIGQRVVNLTSGLITLGSLFAIGANVIGDFVGRAQLMVDLVLFCVVNISLIVVLIALFYNMFFQGKFYQMIVDSIAIGYGKTSVTLTDNEGNPHPVSEASKHSDDLA